VISAEDVFDISGNYFFSREPFEDEFTPNRTSDRTGPVRILEVTL
jgi:hypothetical protein